MKKSEIIHILGTIFATIHKQNALRRDGIYNIEIILEIVVSGVYLHSCIDVYSYSCLHPLSNERKFMFKSGDSRAV